ncbi:hypothetical protein [Thermosyntropha sp.]|uniref:hypothetical protein n=1 Tax=Thermosyntropha sp. TaxID=2740820 RepID=UPI0025EC6742|nr:hypothetical protein [Thermosyntropha sp.]MBO8158850.1 hypothetical protein [Thermosyntropha sp.]
MDFNMNEPLSLTNICGGQLEEDFQKLYRKLVTQLDEGEKANLSISIDLQRVKDTSSMFTISYKITPKYPPRGKASMVRMGKDYTLQTEKVQEKKPKVIGLFNEGEGGKDNE